MSDVSGSTPNQHDSPAKSEHWTAIASTLVAIAILAAGVTASQNRSSSPPVDDVTQWEEDLRFQINSVFRHDARAREKRLATLDAAMRSWKASRQTANDRAELLEWLTDATVRSMPGSVSPLLPAPEFDTKSPKVVAAPERKLKPDASKTPEQPALETPPLAANANPANSNPETLEVPSVSTDVPVTPTPQPDFYNSVELHQPTSVERPEVFAEGPVPTLAPPEVPGSEQGAGSPDLVSLTREETALKPVVTKAEAEAELEVRVNLTELAARIAGYHDALDQVELGLLRAEKPTAKLLEESLERLEKLSADYQFVTLYFGTLSEQEKQGILEPRSLDATLTEVARHLEYVEKNSGDDFLDLFDSAENEQLTTLKSKLERLQESLQGI